MYVIIQTANNINLNVRPMKKRNFLCAALFAAGCSVFAQDPVHGVDGYYNWTPTQMKASGVLDAGVNGQKLAGWERELQYSDDMEYAKLIMGINNASKEEAKGGFNFRSEFVLNESAPGAGVMKITKAYPVVAVKISVPNNDESTSEVKIGDGYFEPEFKWYNPNTGAKDNLPLNGLGSGRYRFFQYGGPLVDMLGRDSVQLNRGNNGYDTYRTAKAVHTNYNDTIWHLIRLQPEANEKAEFLLAMDLSTICSEAADGGGIACLDTTDIVLSGFSLSFLGIYADTLKYTVPGDETSAVVKSKDEMPTVYLKWIKTFPSMKAFDEAITAENNYGDGQPVDPQKAVLNSSLYSTMEFIYNYKFSDQLESLRTAYEAAAAVYNDPSSTSEQYSEQIEALSTARDTFLAAIAYAGESKMNQILNLGGMALGLETEAKTVGGYTGRLLTFVGAENATSFMFTENGTIGGQKAYSLKTSDGTVVQASDGSLILVDASQLNGSNMANFIFGNRGQIDNPGYDLKVGNYYYYFDTELGMLSTIESIPTVDTYDEIANYLYYPMSVDEYDPNDHDAVNYPMTSGEGSAWEFNGEVEMQVEPAYATSFEKYEWDAATKAAAIQRATLPYVEGWSTNGYRMGTLLEVDKSQKDTDGDAISCLKLTCKDKYDDIHSDSVSVVEKVTDWSVSQGVSIMREHGRYTSALNRVPQPNQVCDSLYAINMNSGINRYFAMKWKSNSESVTFNGLTFYVRKSVEEPSVNNANLLEKRGDVYIWDLLDCGIPYGDRKACAQYMSWNDLTSPEVAVYVDWMRFYDSLEDIPEETMAIETVGVYDAEIGGQNMIAVNGNHIQLIGNGMVTVYSVDGRQIASEQVDGEAGLDLPKGMYLVKFAGKQTVSVKKVLLK